VYFERSPPTEEPQGVMLGELPNFIRSDVPTEIFPFYKMGEGNKKRDVYIRGGSFTCAFS